MQNMTSLAFIYILLPVAMAVFLLCPPVWRRGALLLISLGVIFLIQPLFLPLLLACVATDWLALCLMCRYDESPLFRRLCVTFSVVKNLLVILVPEVLLQMNRMVEAPWGLRIYALSAMSCVLETYRRQAPYERSPLSLALYCCFFPRLDGGPLIPYREFAPQLERLNPTLGELGSGFGLFVQGAVKAGVLGGSLQTLYDTLRAFPAEDVSVAGTWCTLFVLALSVYFRLAGISVMARGAAQMMGISLPGNFYFPYQSQSIADFFQRFNITVSDFLRRNVYDALGGDKNGPLADSLNLLIWGVLMGLWFGLRLNYMLWGAYLALFLILEKRLYPRLMADSPTLFKRLYSLCVVLSSFTIFGETTLRASLETIRRMFSFGSAAFYSDRLVYVLSSNWLLLAVSLLFATSAVSLLLGFLRKNLPRVTGALMAAANVALFVILTVFTIRIG